MNNIIQFFQSFVRYCFNAQDSLGYSILIPLATLAAIWLLTFIGLKIFDKKEKLKTVFQIHRTLIICSLLTAMVLVAVICYGWSNNVFAENKAELALIISLIVAFIVPIVSFAILRNYWNKHRINDIVSQPISAEQARNNIPVINKAFNRNKLFYLLPFIGFLFLLFSLNSGKNLISIVFDNSGSMNFSNSYKAMNETLGKLSNNNEIIITTLNGLHENWELEDKKTMKDLMNITSSSKLKAGRNYAYNNPVEAKNALNSILMSSETTYGSPICESIWKMWLFTKESRANNNYKNKLLMVVTDGEENYIKDLHQPLFFYDNDEFAEYYTPENTHILDYSTNGNGILIKKFEESGAEIHPAVTSVDDYLSAFDDALLSFQNNIYLIIWTLTICIIFTFIGLCITPKKITL